MDDVKMINTEMFVTITVKEYESLQKSEDKLSFLEGAGVDNWSGYDDAMEMMREEDE